MTLMPHRWFWPDWRPDRFRRFLDLDLEETFKVEELKEDGELVIRAEVPGIDPEKDVEVTISEGVLHFQVHRVQKAEHRGKAGYHTEFRYGEMTRDLPLPLGYRDEDVRATYKDGILEVRLPMAEEVKPPVTKVPVTVA